MKKLLSAVTSAVMGLTLMTSAFASSVSAAGSLSVSQPNVSMDEVLDVSANRNASAADIEFDFGTWEATPGQDVEVPVKLYPHNHEITSMDLVFAQDSPITIVGISDTATCLDRAAIQKSLNLPGLNFQCLDEDGEGIVAKDGGTVFTLTYHVPENCSSGNYNIGLGTKAEVFKNNTAWTYTTSKLNGVIKVTGGSVVTTTTTGKVNVTTTTTKTNVDPQPTGDIVFDFGNWTAEPGTSVEVPVKLTANKKPITSMDVVFAQDSPITISGIGDTATCLDRAAIQKNLALPGLNFQCLDDEGEGVVAKDGGTVFTLTYEIPANCPAGEYKIGFGNKAEVFKDNTAWTYSVSAINGTITVGGDVTTTSGDKPVTTTTTKVVTPDPTGDIVFDFGNWTAEPGSTLEVPVKLTANKKPITSMDVVFAQDSPITISGIGDTATCLDRAAIQKNLDLPGLNFQCLDDEGEGVVAKDGGTVFTLTYTIPANIAPGEYKIGFGDKAEVFKDNTAWTYSVSAINGTIVIGDITTTTTTTKPLPSGEIEFDFGTWEVTPGQDVEVPVKLTANGNPISSMDVVFAQDSPIELKAIGDTATCLDRAAITSRLELPGLNFQCIDENGDGIVAKDGGTVFTLTYHVPEDCAAGTYNIGFGKKAEVFADNSEFTYKTSKINGVITVKSDVVTTTTVTNPTVTTTTTQLLPVEGEAAWVIPTVKAKAGENVTVNAVVKNSDIEVAGATFSVNAKTPITYVSADDKCDAYKASLFVNDATKEFAFRQADGTGVKAANDTTIISITYKVPAGTAAGTYPVEWSDAIVSDTNGKVITDKINLVNGAIVVEPSEITFDGDIAWVLDKVTAAPGETVTLNAVVSDPNGSKLPVAGAQFKIDAATPITYSSISGSDAYSAAIVKNEKTNEYAFANKTGEGAVSKDGATVLSIKYTVPADCVPGEYAVKWSDGFISDTNGKSLTSQVSLVDGLITVIAPDESSCKWIIPEVEAMPGDTVTMNVIVDAPTGNSPAVAGAQFGINAGAPIEYVSAAGTDAYSAKLVPNSDTKEFAFANTTGEGVKAADGSKVLVLTYKVPENCEYGKYPVKWSDAFISNTDGKSINKFVELVDGFIEVKSSTTTSTTTTSGSTTTTTVTVPKGAIGWQIGTAVGKPGDTVTVKVTVLDTENAALPIAGARIVIKPEAPIEHVSATGSEAYSATLVPNDATQEFAFANKTGEGVAAANGATVMEITYKIPEGTAAGEYPVTYSEKFISSTDGLGISDKVVVFNGAVIVLPDETTTTTTGDVVTTTTTTSKTEPITTTTVTIPAGSIGWQIGTAVGKPGETVTVKVTVLDPEKAALPIAGAQIVIKPTGPIEHVSATGSEAYGATLVPNDDTQEFAFANKTGEGVAAADGAVVMEITYKIPEGTAAGEYPVTYTDKFISSTDGLGISDKVVVVNGAVIVLPDETTTTTTDVTSTTTTTTGDVDTTTTTTGDVVTTTTTTGDVVTTTTTTGDVVTTTTTTGDVVTTTTTTTGTTPIITTTVTVPNGAIGWEIGTAVGKPGETVTVKVTVLDPENSALPIAGAQIVIKPTGPIQHVSATGSEAYGATLVPNDDTQEFAFANRTGEGVAAADGAVVMEITYKIPEGTEDGEYPVTYTGKFISSTDGLSISDKVVVFNGAVIVRHTPDPTTTTTGDVVTTTTTTTGDVDTTTTTTGDVVTTTTTTGDVVTTTTTTGDVVTTTTTTGDVVTTTTTTGDVVTTTTTTGDVVTTTTTTGDVVTTTTTTGDVVTTTTTFDISTTSSTSDITSTSSTTTTTTSTTSTSSTTTTTKPIPAGAIIWRVVDAEGQPGQTVKVKIVVDDPNGAKLPISGVDFTVVPETPVGIAGYGETSDAYGAPITGNTSDGTFQFHNPIGTSVASEDGKTVIEIEFAIPEDCADGDYTIDLSILTISDEDGNTSTLAGRIVPVDGKIKVTHIPSGKKLVRSYAEIDTKPGFYFSHDDGQRQPGVVGGFDKDQVTKLNIYDVYEIDGVEQAPELRTEIDYSKINYNGLTPAKVYDARRATVTDDHVATRNDFIYDDVVQVYYDDLALVDKDGNPLYITAYIGVKGDANLNNVADGSDATDVLWYFGQISGGVGGTTVDRDTIQLTRNSTFVTGVDDPLEQLAAFLCDVTEDEWSEDNWTIAKKDRNIDGTDATLILKYFGLVLRRVDDSSSWYYECWNEAVPNRFGGSAN